MSWIMQDGYPTNTDFIDLPSAAMATPYPHALWRITEGVNDGLPYNMLMPLDEPTGAFMNASQLAKARIPASTKYTGEWAFTNTALTSVRIAQDCEYYPTSFPAGCEVEFYTPDGVPSGTYGQLLDSEGMMIIDADAARVYVTE